MRIIHISLYPAKGEKSPSSMSGVAWYERILINNIPYRESDSVFVICNKLYGTKEVYKEMGVTIVRCFDRNIKFLWQILKEIKKLNPDVIHIQQELALFGNITTAYLLQWMLFFLKKYRLVITLHGVVSLRKVNKNFVRENNSKLPVWLVKFSFRVIYKPLCIWSKKIIVHEEYFKNILIDEYGIKEDKIEVIHLGIEDLRPLQRKEACERIKLDSSKNVVLFMGYATGYKGIDLLIEGFSKYSKNNPNAYLIIGAGKHPKLRNDEEYLKEYARLQNKAQNLINENQHKWIGFIKEKDIINYYSASDVSVIPYTISMSSSGPMAFAVGYEKPFLASDVFSEVIEDGSIIFKRTPDDLAKKLDDFFNNKGNFQKGLEKMKKERLWINIGKQTYEIYK